MRIDGRDHYLGAYGTPEAKAAYDRLIAEWLANGRRLPESPDPEAVDGVSLAELMLAYLKFADAYYGPESKEPELLRLSLRPLKALYAMSPAREFTPLKLKAVRQAMIEADVCRPEINRRVGRILRMLRWGVSEELVPPAILQALKAVDGLKRGRTAAREPEPIRPVEDRVVDATLPHLLPPVRALVELLRLTGARTGELCVLRTMDVDRSGDVWKFTPLRHKGQHRGKGRVIYLGPKAQGVLSPWLKPEAPEAFVFSPREAMRLRWAEQRAARKTKVQPSQRSRKKEEPGRMYGERYTTHAVSKAITTAVDRHNRGESGGEDVPRWHPHQLRHAAGTRFRAAYGLEAAQLLLGHARADVTEVYAERDEKAVLDVVRKVG